MIPSLRSVSGSVEEKRFVERLLACHEQAEVHLITNEPELIRLDSPDMSSLHFMSALLKVLGNDVKSGRKNGDHLRSVQIMLVREGVLEALMEFLSSNINTLKDELDWIPNKSVPQEWLPVVDDGLTISETVFSYLHLKTMDSLPEEVRHSLEELGRKYQSAIQIAICATIDNATGTENYPRILKTLVEFAQGPREVVEEFLQKNDVAMVVARLFIHYSDILTSTPKSASKNPSPEAYDDLESIAQLVLRYVRQTPTSFKTLLKAAGLGKENMQIGLCDLVQILVKGLERSFREGKTFGSLEDVWTELFDLFFGENRMDTKGTFAAAAINCAAIPLVVQLAVKSSLKTFEVEDSEATEPLIVSTSQARTTKFMSWMVHLMENSCDPVWISQAITTQVRIPERSKHGGDAPTSHLIEIVLHHLFRKGAYETDETHSRRQFISSFRILGLITRELWWPCVAVPTRLRLENSQVKAKEWARAKEEKESDAFHAEIAIQFTLEMSVPSEMLVRSIEARTRSGMKCAAASCRIACSAKQYYSPTEKPKLYTCGGCKRTLYSSSECQRSDWKKHKEACQNAQAMLRARAVPELSHFEMSHLFMLALTITADYFTRNVSESDRRQMLLNSRHSDTSLPFLLQDHGTLDPIMVIYLDLTGEALEPEEPSNLPVKRFWHTRQAQFLTVKDLLEVLESRLDCTQRNIDYAKESFTKLLQKPSARAGTIVFISINRGRGLTLWADIGPPLAVMLALESGSGSSSIMDMGFI